MGNVSINRPQGNQPVQRNQKGQAAAGQSAQTPAAPPMPGDNLSLTQIRGEVMNLEVRITEFKMQEEQRLGGMLDQQLSFLEGVAKDQKDVLMGNLDVTKQELGAKLERVSKYRDLLPAVVEYGSEDYAHHMQITDREQDVMKQMSQAEIQTMRQVHVLDNYVASFRTRSNPMLAQINAKTLAGSDEMDKRIQALRSMIGELGSSPLSRDLIATRFK